VALLEQLGHRVEEADPVIEVDRMWRDFAAVVFAHTAMQAQWARDLGGEAYRMLEPVTISMARIGQSLGATDLLGAQQGWHDVRMAMGRYLQQYDVLLTPTLVNPPVALGVLPPTALEERLLGVVNTLPVGRLLYRSSMLEQMMLPVLGQMAFTAVGNVTGLPAMSVPLHWTAQGLPLGMQFTGRMCDEYTLYQLAGQLERAQPWFDRRPDPMHQSSRI
jgi:amidase